MARARNIKPGFFQNDELGELPPLARLLFIGLWTIADFKGCLELKPKRIKVQLLPYDDCDVIKLANNLDKSGFISIYSVLGQQYIKINNFDKHQNPHKNEREAGSDIPDIDKKDIEINELKQNGINPDKNGTARADSLFPLPDSGFPQTESLAIDCRGNGGASLPEQKKTPAPKKESETAETWNAYELAYSNRYGTNPVRNATVNAKLSQFVKRIGIEESPHVASFFVGHNNSFYVRKMHDVGLLLSDAEKLRTEWATNTRMTATRAAQTDRTQTNLDAFGPLIAAAERKEREGQNGE